MVHDRSSWQLMNGIEQALGCEIVRVDGADVEEMESTLKKALKA